MTSTKKERVLYIKAIDPKAVDLYTNHNPAFEGDSGLDLFTLYDVNIRVGETIMIDLGIQCELIKTKTDIESGKTIVSENESYYLYLRSSTGLNTPLRLANQVAIIDGKYRGNIKVLLTHIATKENIDNIISTSCDVILEYSPQQNILDIEHVKEHIIGELPVYQIKAGTKLVQLCTGGLKMFKTKLVDTLSETVRGDGCFGSTGISVNIEKDPTPPTDTNNNSGNDIVHLDSDVNGELSVEN